MFPAKTHINMPTLYEQNTNDYLVVEANIFLNTFEEIIESV